MTAGSSHLTIGIGPVSSAGEPAVVTRSVVALPAGMEKQEEFVAMRRSQRE
jgi:hypothetical protein